MFDLTSDAVFQDAVRRAERERAPKTLDWLLAEHERLRAAIRATLDATAALGLKDGGRHLDLGAEFRAMYDATAKLAGADAGFEYVAGQVRADVAAGHFAPEPAPATAGT